MGKLIDKLQQVGKGGESGMGFARRASGQAPRPAAVLVALRATDAAVAEAAAKNGADAVIITGWTPKTDVAPITKALASGGAATLWGVEVGELDADASETLKAARTAGASFAIVPATAPAAILFDEVEQFDRVVTLAQPDDQMALLLLRAANALPVQAAFVRLDLSSAALARLSVTDFTRLKLIAESLRFPLLVALPANEAPDATATNVLVRLGVDGVTLQGTEASAESVGAQVKAVREQLEKTPAPKDSGDGPISVGGLMGMGGLRQATRPAPEPDEE
ncbi:MAG TPA: hypothetical protein VMV29_18590 [Ktedonobacterales bacterium]|nr:hypothetical protein [Ktedonobacterales bacterium]